MIQCRRCDVEKPDEDFHRQTGSKTGHQGVCKVCAIEGVIQWQRDHPEQHQRKVRRSKLKQKYGITEDDYDRRLAAQGGRCAICREAPRGTGPRGASIPLAVDHDHETGQVRGLLCLRCNRAIGYLGDTLEALLRAREYLSGSS